MNGDEVVVIMCGVKFRYNMKRLIFLVHTNYYQPHTIVHIEQSMEQLWESQPPESSQYIARLTISPGPAKNM